MRRALLIGLVVLPPMVFAWLIVQAICTTGRAKKVDSHIGELEAIVALQDSCFDAGWTKDGYSGDEHSHSSKYQVMFRHGHHTFKPKTRPASDVRLKLLAVMRDLNKAAIGNGFALVPGGFECRSFGPVSTPATKRDLSWGYSTETWDGRSRGGATVALKAADQHVYASLTFASRENLAVTFNWTIVLDTDSGVFQLFTRYTSLVPVYVGQDTPELHRLGI